MTLQAIRQPVSFIAWLKRIRSECYVFSPVLFAVMLLHGEFFFRSGSPFEQHFLAFPGVRELYIALCGLAAGSAVVEGLRRGRFFSGDLVLIFFVSSFALGSAVLAYLKFGQPIIFGLFEERRVLMFFGLFLILAAYHQFDDRPEALIGAVYWTALIYLVLGLVMQAGALGDLSMRDIPAFDPRKYRILVGSNLYAASVMIGAVMIIRFNAWEHLVPVLVGTTGLLVISQTRSTILILAVAVVLFFAVTALWRFLLIAACVVIGTIAFLLWPTPPSRGVDVLVAEIDVRVNTAGKIFDALYMNDWIGMGALSLQWQNGFHRVYDRFFYLSDVGVVGELYRFGMFLPIIYAGLAITLFCYFRQAMDPHGRSIGYGLLLLFILNAPGGGLVAFAGINWALLIAFTIAFRLPSALPRTMSTRLRVKF
ncbi:MAG TPA: hypothetical protein ENH11_01910 [Candidatus Acetothermia bacterium]|nr:hypothetical protein [Candidatus Acetothermia bacterium]